MNERDATIKGYQFTGVYSRNKNEVKAQKDRFKGYKTLLITVPDSKYSRSGGGEGYSIYAEPKYFIAKNIQELTNIINSENSKLAKAEDDYKIAVNKIKIEIENAKQRLIDVEKEFQVLSEKE